MPKIIEKVLHFMKIKKRFVQIFFSAKNHVKLLQRKTVI